MGVNTRMPSQRRFGGYAVRRSTLDSARSIVHDNAWIGISIAGASAIFTAIAVVLTALNTDRLTSVAPWVVVTISGIVGFVLWVLFLILRFRGLAVFIALASALVIGGAGITISLGFSKTQAALACDRAKGHIESGRNFADARIENRAVSEFSVAMGACVDGLAHLYRGQALSAIGRRQVAIDDLNAALQLLPPQDISSVREVYLKRGQDHLALGDCDAAAADLKQSTRVDPTFDPAFANLALARASQGILRSPLPDDALRDINHALELNPKQAVYLYPKAKIEVLLGDVASAEVDLNSAINNSGTGDQDTKSGAVKLLDGLVAGRPQRQLFDPCR